MRGKRDWGLGIGDWRTGIKALTPLAPRPLPFALRASGRARGVSLIEVLISVFVLSVGMLGLAALLPVGRMTILETTKADRSGDCGRAALRDLKIRRMLDSEAWAHGFPDTVTEVVDQTNIWTAIWDETRAQGSPPSRGARSLVIDPLARSKSLLTATDTTRIFGKTFAASDVPIPRVMLKPLVWDRVASQTILLAPRRTLAERIFVWPDDLVLSMPEEMSPPQPMGRPRLLQDVNGSNVMSGDYSWFATVTPAVRPTPVLNAGAWQPIWPPDERLRFTVSIVVCYRRDFSERSVQLIDPNVATPFPDNGLGGGSVVLDDLISNDAISVRENQWVALCSRLTGLCKWYRVVGISDDAHPTKTNRINRLTLSGPDWQPSVDSSSSYRDSNGSYDYMVALGASVIGVYTTTVELDQDPAWRN